LEERVRQGAINYKLRTGSFRASVTGANISDLLENGRHHSLSESELPLVPPELEDYKPTGTGEPPLAKAKIGFATRQKRRARPTHAAMGRFLLVYLRFCDPANESRSSEKS